MTEFGSSYQPGQNNDRRLTDGQFDQNIIYDDNVIELAESPNFSQQVTYEDEVLFISPSFNDKIVSKSHNYVQDYFELRAQPGQVSGGGALPSPLYDYGRYEPHPGTILFTRNVSGEVENITTLNSVGTKSVDFTRVDGVVTSIDIDNYGTKRNIGFTRTNGQVEQITITNTT